MKRALITDYSDGSVLLVNIPQEWEEDADTFVQSLPAFDDSECNYMIVDGEIGVYDIVEDGKGDDGSPYYDYVHRLTL